MYSVHSLDREEVDFALAYLTGALPCKTRSVVLLTLAGELVGQCLAHYDSRQLATMYTNAKTLAGQMTDDLGTGDFRFNLNVGANGAALTLLLDGTYLVCISAREVRSYDAIIQAVQEGIAPLMDVLGINRA